MAAWMPSWVLARLDDATRARHAAADRDRLTLLSGEVTIDRYIRFLLHVFGFEVAVETALHMTPGIDELLDLRARCHIKRLKCDLLALDVPNVATIPRCRVGAFGTVLEAMGWVYAIERNVQVHDVLRQHLAVQLPGELALAGTYLSESAGARHARLRDLGASLDSAGRTAAVVDRITMCAHAAFRAQHHWFASALPPRLRVA